MKAVYQRICETCKIKLTIIIIITTISIIIIIIIMIRSVVYPENWLFLYRNLTNYKYNKNLEIHKLTKLGIKLKLLK